MVGPFLIQSKLIISTNLQFSFSQVRTMLQEKQYALQIKEALEHIKESQKAVSDYYTNDQNLALNTQRSKLKSKGVNKIK